jgi:hypothetical protein
VLRMAQFHQQAEIQTGRAAAEADDVHDEVPCLIFLFVSA